MKHTETLIKAISTSGSMCDDCLASFTGISPRQTVNIVCRALAEAGNLDRRRQVCGRCHREKIVNAYVEHASPSIQAARLISAGTGVDRPWYWEGNVQSKLASWLRESGWSIAQEANTSTRETGIDLIANRGPKQLWVSVKGWPENSPNVQARHWFAGAILDVVRYRDIDHTVRLAIGIPSGYKTYQNLVNSVQWLRRTLPLLIMEVSQAGDVRVTFPPGTESAL